MSTSVMGSAAMTVQRRSWCSWAIRASLLATPERTGDRLPCPACDKPMSPVSLRGVEIDRCYHDQLLWFDPTELGVMRPPGTAEHIEDGQAHGDENAR